ncbi:AAR2 protein family [Striga asiatica]|uniref:AAR2 protein family n=1 Tax=Striga asiatica TaxID=4170 RepID=A0A5A7PLG8_STRAF|nr:AAR2 protein family [Striga asiatica]
MSDKEMESDSDAPEVFSVRQGMQQDEEIRKVQRENKARVVREVKERRRKWAKNLTPKPLPKERSTIDESETKTETNEDSQGNNGMLLDDIVKLLAAREKIVFTSDSEDEKVEKRGTSKKRKLKRSRLEPVILKEIPSAQCV